MFIRPEDVRPVAEENRVFFQIPIRNYARFEREIARLSKRTEKATGQTIDIMKMGTLRDKKTGKDYFEVYLDAPDATLDGYQFLARLDHSQETGNIIRMLPNVRDELPVQYRTVAPKCDHCRVNRLRRDTFVLRNETNGEMVQLGSTCMADFFTTDPRAVAKLAELVGYAREAAVAAQTEEYADWDNSTGKAPRTLKDVRYMSLTEYLAYCAAVKRIDGRFISSANYDESTKIKAFMAMYGCGRSYYSVLPEDHDTVERALAWVDGIAARRDAGEKLSDYEHNILVVGQASVIEGRAAGLAASIVGCFDRPVPAWKLPKPVVAPKPALVLTSMLGMIELFRKAKAQWPKIIISFPDTGEIVLSVAGPRSQYPGSINVKSTGDYDHAKWYGRIHTDGRWEPTRSREANLPQGLELALVKFAADPAGVAAEYGKRTGNCCFCRIPLKDARSVAVGYGATCAKNYGLPYGVKAMREALAA